MNYDVLAEQTAEENNFPNSMEFELANTCNLECVMCNGYYSSTIRKNVEHLPPIENAYPADFVEQLEEFIPHLKKTRFLGGEPFLIKIYFDIWLKMKELNYSGSLQLTTNGTVLNKKVTELLNALDFELTISIDSFNEKIYERIRGGANFKTVMRNFEWFKNYMDSKGKQLSVAYCPMTLNAESIVDDFNFCNANSVIIILNSVIQPQHFSFQYLPKDELKNVRDLFSGEI